MKPPYGIAVQEQRSRPRDGTVPGAKRAMAITVLWGNIAAFLVAPVLALSSRFHLIFPVPFVGAALLGATFPLISHASIDPNERNAGAKLSYLYLSKILGSACGSFAVGFVIVNYFSTKTISFGLLAPGGILGCGLMIAGRGSILNWRRAVALAAALCVVEASGPLYSSLHERLPLKSANSAANKFGHPHA